MVPKRTSNEKLQYLAIAKGTGTPTRGHMISFGGIVSIGQGYRSRIIGQGLDLLELLQDEGLEHLLS